MIKLIQLVALVANFILIVSPTSKALTCSENEVYSNCTNGGCIGPRKCTEIGGPIICHHGEDKEACEKGCICKTCFLRDSSGVCIPENQCPNAKCDGRNEQYECCPKICPPQTCESLKPGAIYFCPAQLEPPLCHGQCMCTPGYYRNYLNDCISKEDCNKCPGPHEYFSCGGACDNVCATLATQSQDNCPIKTFTCNRRCYCEKGYARDDNGVCIPIKDCPCE